MTDATFDNASVIIEILIQKTIERLFAILEIAEEWKEIFRRKV